MVKNSKNHDDDEIMDKNINETKSEVIAIEDMPTTTLREYRLYNEAARKANKKLGVCRHKIKQCPIELHPKQRIKFGNNDQSLHPVPVYLSNELIHFDQKLTPGKSYDLPECIVHYLSEKGYPVWDWVNLPDGSKETRQTGKKPRFSLTTVYSGEY